MSGGIHCVFNQRRTRFLSAFASLRLRVASRRGSFGLLSQVKNPIKLYFRKNKSVLVVIFMFQNANACLTPLASLQAARCFRRRCACSASSLARSPERTSPEQGLENAQNGKGQLWAKVGMRLGSAPRSLGVGAVLQGAGNEATFAACGPHGSVGVVVAGNTQTAGIVILRSPIRHTLRKRSGYAGMPKRQTISF